MALICNILILESYSVLETREKKWHFRTVCSLAQIGGFCRWCLR